MGIYVRSAKKNGTEEFSRAAAGDERQSQFIESSMPYRSSLWSLTKG